MKKLITLKGREVVDNLPTSGEESHCTNNKTKKNNLYAPITSLNYAEY